MDRLLKSGSRQVIEEKTKKICGIIVRLQWSQVAKKPSK
jgi:hypothetical protein